MKKKKIYGFKKERKRGTLIYYKKDLPNGQYVVALIRKKVKKDQVRFYMNISLRRKNFQVEKSLYRCISEDYNIVKEEMHGWIKKEGLRLLFVS